MNNEKNQLVPSCFIDKNTVGQMNVGDIGYVSRLTTLFMDKEHKLWINLHAPITHERTGSSLLDIYAGAGSAFSTSGAISMSTFVESIKIERTEKGYKVYLFEHHEYLQNQMRNCDQFVKCSDDSNRCACIKSIRKNLFIPSMIRESILKDFELAAEFDEARLDVNKPGFIESLTVDLLKEIETPDLRLLLESAAASQLYEQCRIIQSEINLRKNS